MKPNSSDDTIGISVARKQVDILFVPCPPLSFNVSARHMRLTQTTARPFHRAVKKIPSPDRLTDFGFYLKASMARRVNVAAGFTTREA
jgi:hypothetical protein